MDDFEWGFIVGIPLPFDTLSIFRKGSAEQSGSAAQETVKE